MRKISLFIGLLIGSCSLQAQDWSWNETHGWEVWMPSWKTFITVSSGFLGPNALPVPDHKKGLNGQRSELEFSTDFHFHPGDKTENLSGRFYYPFADGKIAVEVYGILFEHYRLSAEVRDERASRNEFPNGITFGDLYFTTLIQLARNRKFPNTLLRIAGKTASGGKLEDARYADAPGYYFDLSFSEAYIMGSPEKLFIPFGMLGFYSWQTNSDLILQNDAFLYGAGFDMKFGKWCMGTSLSGYSGYHNNGDKPVVYKAEVRKQFEKNTFRIQFLRGIRDWNYSTFKFSYIWYFKKD